MTIIKAKVKLPVAIKTAGRVRLPLTAFTLDYIILRSQGTDGHRWKFTVDDTGMLSQPGEDLGV